MKPSIAVLISFMVFNGSLGFAAEKETVKPPAKVSVRMKFVPTGPPAKGSSDFKGASFTDLGQGPVKGELWCQAHAGVGDKFPVINKEGVTLFEVLLAAGDDAHVLLEIRWKEGFKKIDLPRDKAGSVVVSGIKYGLSYPSVSVAAAPDEKPTTNKAMLMVTRRL